MKHNKIVEDLEITGISAEGKSIAKKDGKVYFIGLGAPGDKVDIQVRGKRKGIFEGDIIKTHHSSSHRTTPVCEHFGICGGCKWQHINYGAQLQFKFEHVKENLKKISKVELPELQPIIGSIDTFFYRNKLEFTFSNNRWLTRSEIDSGEDFSRNALGFHIPRRFDKILHIDKCHLQAEPSNNIRLSVHKFAEEHSIPFFDLKDQTGLLRNLIIRTASTGYIMVIVQFYHEDDKNELLLEHLKNSFPEITSLQYIINPKQNETFYDLPVHVYAGEPFITEQMEGLSFRVGPKSFYQTNSKQAYELYKVARSFADLKGDEVVYDLYTGTGTIANFVAGQAAKVIGVESVEEAIIDARKNSELNNITNTTFLAGDMKDMFTDHFVKKHGHPDVIITDPPRAGMHPKVIEVLNRIKPERLVYVSCNPATQARDLQLLDEAFIVRKIQPVDMFPQTHHVENVVLLTAR
ncbi:23S rRNA (uracil(1939)-C(5))-methyltransferase RlmD [Marinoscillum sp. MHG1-6]|uniref:23S rRNA (uracil(1939)-C(5))-methyltransferase RlmD n=1 Tax=Marinoscillum sp. MHG1-6 TaxID=2959627 RepID=UPI002157C45D|nr:23S rRNA (uracil(1939)-C(5))-methyltransferase RlmD [Marinoscillum sp. MHG1-6]